MTLDQRSRLVDEVGDWHFAEQTIQRPKENYPRGPSEKYFVVRQLPNAVADRNKGTVADTCKF